MTRNPNTAVLGTQPYNAAPATAAALTGTLWPPGSAAQIFPIPHYGAPQLSQQHMGVGSHVFNPQPHAISTMSAAGDASRPNESALAAACKITVGELRRSVQAILLAGGAPHPLAIAARGAAAQDLDHGQATGSPSALSTLAYHYGMTYAQLQARVCELPSDDEVSQAFASATSEDFQRHRQVFRAQGRPPPSPALRASCCGCAY